MPLGTLPPCPPYLGKGGPGLSKAPLGGCPQCGKPLGGCGCPCPTLCGYFVVYQVCEYQSAGCGCKISGRVFRYCCNEGQEDGIEYIRRDDYIGACGLEERTYIVTTVPEGNYMFPPCPGFAGTAGVWQAPFLPPVLEWALSILPAGEMLCENFSGWNDVRCS